MLRIERIDEQIDRVFNAGEVSISKDEMQWRADVEQGVADFQSALESVEAMGGSWRYSTRTDGRDELLKRFRKVEAEWEKLKQTVYREVQ